MADNDQTPLSDIVDRSPKSEPATREAPAPAEKPSEPIKDETGRLHDPASGKFFPKTPPAEKPAAPAPEPSGEKPQAASPPPGDAPTQPPHGHVPVSALIDQRLEARQYRQRVAELERRLQEIQNTPQERTDFFQDPDAAFDQRLSPLEQRIQTANQAATLRFSKLEAMLTYGREAYEEMEAAVGQAMEAGDRDVFDLREQLLKSEDPAGLAMKWHQRRKILADVGDDPKTYREKIREEERLAVIAEIEAAGGTVPQPATKTPTATTAMPSNLLGAANKGARTGPAWTGPAPISEIFDRKRSKQT